MRVNEPFFKSKTSGEGENDSGGHEAKLTSLLLGFTEISLDMVKEVEQFIEKTRG